MDQTQNFVVEVPEEMSQDNIEMLCQAKRDGDTSLPSKVVEKLRKKREREIEKERNKAELRKIREEKKKAREMAQEMEKLRRREMLRSKVYHVDGKELNLKEARKCWGQKGKEYGEAGKSKGEEGKVYGRMGQVYRGESTKYFGLLGEASGDTGGRPRKDAPKSDLPKTKNKGQQKQQKERARQRKAALKKTINSMLLQ